MTSTESYDDAAARLKCDAPRVSLKDIEAEIVHTEFVKHVSHGGQVLRWCVLTTKSGFAVTGDASASVSKENDRQELGERSARESAIRELWKYMAFNLKNKVAADRGL